FKVYEAVNSNLLGLNKNERKSGDYQLHPLIRDDWRSVDKYRDLQGNVPALTTNVNGDLIVDERVAVGGSSFFRPFRDRHSDYTQIDGSSPSDTKTIELRVENYLTDWNEGNINEIAELNNLLKQNNPNNDFAGIPYFEKFFHIQEPPDGEPFGLLTTDARMAGATRNIKPIMQQEWTAGLGAGSPPILNHKFNYRYYDRTMQNSTYNIEVESTYNLFLDTDPDYEAAIADVSEATIPNFYHIEISTGIVQNNPSGTIPPAYKLFDNSVINYEDYSQLLAGSLSGSDITEDQTNSQGFLQFYANNVSNISEDYKTDFGNVAVLSHDVADGILSAINGTIRDDRGTTTEQDDFYAIETYPFYNKITIPHLNQWAGTDIIGGLKGALTLEWTQNFITLLEILIIEEYKGSNTPDDSLPFVIYDTDDGNRVVSQSQNVDLAIRVEDVLTALLPSSEGPLHDRIEKIFFMTGAPNYFLGLSNSTKDAGASFIQNYTDMSTFNSFFNDFAMWYVGLDPNDIQTALDIFGSFRNGPTGDFRGIYQSRGGTNYESNHLDTPIMYMVEKRVIPVGQLSVDANDPSTVVQRLFFGRDITGGEKGITYYDTQIKYGVRYQYDIKQIRLVVGEQYYYHNYLSITNSGSVHQGRAIGNALGFYAEENTDITSTQTFQIANNLEGFSYLPEDEDTGFEDRTHFGYYVYKIPPDVATSDTLDEAVNNIDDIFGVPGGVADDGGFGPGRGQGPGTNLNLLLIKIRGGDGFDGNFDGGAIGVSDVGTSAGVGQGQDDDDDDPLLPGAIFEEEFEVDEEVIDQMTGQGAQAAQRQATSQKDAEITSQMSSGQIQTGGVSVNIRTGQVNIPGLTNLPGNPGGPSASGGFGGNIPNISNLSPN
ncbi:MAG: hypothetical protein VW270_03695, partial [Candidatus Poseidoniales archaeon]